MLLSVGNWILVAAISSTSIFFEIYNGSSIIDEDRANLNGNLSESCGQNREGLGVVEINNS
jgi:hypothetical protein